jgi:hypothetical protein
MKLRLKLVSSWKRPELSKGDRGLSLLTLGVLRPDSYGWRLELAWKRCAVAGLVSFGALYLAVVTALWNWLDREPRNQVTWSTLALAPIRWDEFRTKRGDTAIAQALEQLRQRQYGEAYFNLTAGIARSPGNVRGRVALAMLQAAGEPTRAITTLEAGLRHEPVEVDLLRPLFKFYEQQLARARMVATIDALRQRQPAVSPEVRRFLALAQAAVLIDQGEGEAAARLLSEAPPTGASRDDALQLSVRAELLAQAGRSDEARQLAAALPAATPAAERARVEALIAMSTGDTDAFERAIRRWRVLAPQDPSPYIVAFQGWHRQKRFTFRDAAEQDFYAAFGSSDSALQLFAATCVNLDLPDAVQRCLDEAVRARLSDFAFRVHLTEIALRRGDLDGALRQLHLWEKQIETLRIEQRSYPEFIARLVRLAVAGAGAQDEALLAHLSQMRGRASVPMYRLAATVLERAGRADAALAVARQGAQFYPFSDGLAEISRRLDDAQIAATPAAPRRVDLKPAAEVPATADETWRAIDAAFEREEFTRVRDLLRAVRQNRPGWFAGGAERELALREIRLAVFTQDLTDARAMVRAQIESLRAAEDGLRVLELAKLLAERERFAEARLLRDEVLARHGGHAAVVAAARALALPDDLAPLLAGAPAALAAIDDALTRGRVDDALRALDYVRQQGPAWLDGARTELAIREVRVRLALRQRPLAFALFKEIVLRPGAPRSAAFKLVRDLLAGGDREPALQLAREIVRLLPDDPAAAKLLKEAEAPRPASGGP